MALLHRVNVDSRRKMRDVAQRFLFSVKLTKILSPSSECVNIDWVLDKWIY
jgi:hypothetical protein